MDKLLIVIIIAIIIILIALLIPLDCSSFHVCDALEEFR